MKRLREVVNEILGSRKRMTWAIIAAIAVVLLAVGGISAYRILRTPQSLFRTTNGYHGVMAGQSKEQTPGLEGEASQNAAQLPTATPEGNASADASAAPAGSAAPITASEPPGKKDEIVNILLIGIDREQDGRKYSGQDPHADVMMIVAVNFTERKADLISLPRDTFVHAPDVMNGVYKLNASFNVGGGFKAKHGEGFRKVCEAAEYMLGGIPIDYYYAVDFGALIKVVDTIGGVDFDVESREYSREGRSGLQHMNGLDVLFYVRSRRFGPEKGDVNRVNRQKKMMVAIFKQLKDKGKLSMIPDLIGSVNKGFFTNTKLQQTLALVNFAKDLDLDHIGLHSMSGEMALKAGWSFCFTDQQARKELIHQIYGVDVPSQAHCSSQYADWLVDYGFSVIRYLKTAKQLLDYVDQHKADLSVEQQTAFAALAASYADTQSAYDIASVAFSKENNHVLQSAKGKLRTDTEKLAKLLQYQKALQWTYSSSYWRDPAINEVLVDFR